jgi:integrase/recombinase XerD
LNHEKISGIDCVREEDIERFYTYQQERPNFMTGGTLSESRITLHMYSLKVFFTHLQETEEIQVSPMANLDYTRDYKRTRENLLSVDDIGKLYGECETARERTLLGMIYGCGLRREEAVKLNAKDVQFKTGMLHVREGKGGRKRTIPLSKSVLDDFKDYYFNERPSQLNYRTGDIDAFMVNRIGRRMKGDSYLIQIKRLINKAKLDKQITLHHFRHAIATHLLESGMKTEHVKDFLGHMSIETTQTYTHVTVKEIKKTTAYDEAQRLPARTF